MTGRRAFLAGSASLLATGGAMGMGEPDLWVPPEEAAHELTVLQWPVSRRVHPDPVFLRMLQKTIANIANAIAQFEPVILLADEAHHASIKRLISGNITLWDVPTDDLWCRDSGPLIAKTPGGKRVVSHVQFNGWGEKQIHRNDGKVAERLAERFGFALVPSGLTGEAGGIEHDGHGLLMAHESSWVNDNRNPGMSRAEIERRLTKAYGAERMIWAPGVWGEDITDYHIDSLARFVAPGKVLINLPDDPDMQDPFHRSAIETHDILKAEGLELDVIPEPVIPRVTSTDFVASYANYYVCNGAVIAAEFGDRETDEIARAALQRHFRDREIVMLQVDALGEVGGGIHCATQQLPT